MQSGTVALPPTFTSDGGRPGAVKNNIIWIVLDALRQDVFQEYLRRGGFRQLVEQGLSFTDAYSQGSWTYPSFFSFLTGRLPFNCGASVLVPEGERLVSACGNFDDACPTIFSILRQHDYRVGSVLDGWGFTVRETAGQAQREDRYFVDHWGWTNPQDQRFLALDDLLERSTAFVQAGPSDNPYFLFVRSLFTHSPYRGIFSSPEYVTALSRRRWTFRIVEGFIRGLERFEREFLDPLLSLLEQRGERDRTMIVISSDHGEMLWNLEDDLRAREASLDPEAWRHQLEPYEALIRVPLLIAGGRLRGQFQQRFRLIDVVPTLLDEIGISYGPESFDGVSAYHQGARPIYADSAGYGHGGIAFRSLGKKLLMSQRLGAVSYELPAHGFESIPLRRGADDVVAELREFLGQTSTVPLSSYGQAHDAVLEKRLRALGYIA